MGKEYIGSGTIPQRSDTRRLLLVKEINATLGSGGGTGGAGIVGTGSPEGAVTATPGTSYFNTSTDSFWYKKTGVGATGWSELIN